MAKEVLAKKIIIELNEDGTLITSQCQYKIRTDGVTEKMTKSITIDSVIGSSLTDILVDVNEFVKEGEGI